MVMWILMMLVMTSDGVVAYDQGRFDDRVSCEVMMTAMKHDIDVSDVLKLKCIEW